MRDEYVHDAIEPLLIEYVAGTLNADGRRKVESHIINCDPCRYALEEWRQIADAARRETPVQLLPPLDWQRIKGETPVILAQPRHVSHRRTQSFQFVMPAAFIALMAGAAMLFGMMGGGPSNDGNFGAAPVIEQRATDIPQLLPSATMTVAPDAAIQQTPTVEPTVAPPPTVQYENGFNMKAIPPDVRPVIVAANNIENGAVIMPHDLTVYLIFTELVPEGAEFNPDDIVYTIARSNISCGQILTRDYSVDNARDVPAGQPLLGDIEGCIDVEHTYRPGAGGIARDYDGRLYPQPVGQTANVLLFTRDIEAGEVITEADIAPAPDYPIELVPPTALTDPESFIGQTLAAPVVAGQILAAPVVTGQIVVPSSLSGVMLELSSPSHTGVFVPRTAVELPNDAKRGDIFDIVTQLTDSSESSIAINDVVLWHLDSKTLILEVRVEDEPVLTELIRDGMMIRLMRSE